MELDLTKTYSLTYIDAKLQVTRRRIQPIEWADAQTLVAYCFLRRDFRHFLVDRIQAIEPTLLTLNAQDEVNQALADRWVVAETF